MFAFQGIHDWICLCVFCVCACLFLFVCVFMFAFQGIDNWIYVPSGVCKSAPRPAWPCTLASKRWSHEGGTTAFHVFSSTTGYLHRIHSTLLSSHYTIYRVYSIILLLLSMHSLLHNVYSVHYICAHLLNFAHTAEKSEDPVCAECARDFDKASLDSPSANREIITFSSKVLPDFFCNI